MGKYVRNHLFDPLWNALHGTPNLMQAIVGPRQVGKTTLALQVIDKWQGPKIYETADEPDIPTLDWIRAHWERARKKYREQKLETLLIFDEIQKIPKWSNVVKKLCDEDKRLGLFIRVVLLGSSSLLMQKGLAESLAGRFELRRHSQWSLRECQECFNIDFDEYVYFGGYPGALPLIKDEPRWARYIRDSLIETVLSKDVILISPVTKPALLRQTFGLAVTHPAQIMSYQKMLGTLQDAGNTTTIASYLRLLFNAFLVSPLEKWSGSRIKRRGSTPKILALDNALTSSMMGGTFQATRQNPSLWGRLIENIVGARLYWLIEDLGGELYYWRLRQQEIDFVIRLGNRIMAVEVKSNIPDKKPAVFSAFCRKYKEAEPWIISKSGEKTIEGVKNIQISSFLEDPKKIFE